MTLHGPARNGPRARLLLAAVGVAALGLGGLATAGTADARTPGQPTGIGCQVTDGPSSKIVLDHVSSKPVHAEFTFNSDTALTEHLVVRNTPQTYFFRSTGVTSVTCLQFADAPHSLAHENNYLVADGTGTYGRSATTGVAGYTYRIEIHVPRDASGRTTMTFILRDAKGALVKRVSGTFTTPSVETDYPTGV